MPRNWEWLFLYATLKKSIFSNGCNGDRPSEYKWFSLYINMFLRNSRYLLVIGGGGVNNWVDLYSYTHISPNHSSIGELNKLQEPRIYISSQIIWYCNSPAIPWSQLYNTFYTKSFEDVILDIYVCLF